jgi:hypothetical protein
MRTCEEFKLGDRHQTISPRLSASLSISCWHKHLTVNHIYWPLANSKGHILGLTRAQRAGSGDERRKRLHQFLSDIGVKALRQHLGQLLGIAQVSRDQVEYEGHVRRIFGEQLELDV